MTTVTPAYGRDYKTAAAAKAAWKSGKDFLLRDITSRYDGKPCSCRDFAAGARVAIRFDNMRKMVVAR